MIFRVEGKGDERAFCPLEKESNDAWYSLTCVLHSGHCEQRG